MLFDCLRPDGKHGGNKQILHKDPGQFGAVAGGNLESFLKKNLEEKECPENGAESRIDDDKILSSPDIAAQCLPESCEQIGQIHFVLCRRNAVCLWRSSRNYCVLVID